MLGPGGNECEGRRRDIRGNSTCPVLPPNGCVTLEKLLSEPQLLYSRSGDVFKMVPTGVGCYEGKIMPLEGLLSTVSLWSKYLVSDGY